MYIGISSTRITSGCTYNPNPEFSITSESPETLKDYFRVKYSKVNVRLSFKESQPNYDEWWAHINFKCGISTYDVLIVIKRIGFLK